jgi:hypothetical protein
MAKNIQKMAKNIQKVPSMSFPFFKNFMLSTYGVPLFYPSDHTRP